MAAAGCGAGSEASSVDWIGTWVGQKELPNEGQVPEGIRQTLKEVRVRLDADGAFLLIDSGVPYEGRFSTTGRTAALKIEKMLNRTISARDPEYQRLSQPVELTATDRGTLLLRDTAGFSPDAVELTREVEGAGPRKSS